MPWYLKNLDHYFLAVDNLTFVILLSSLIPNIDQDHPNLVVCSVKPVLSDHSKRGPKIGFSDRLSLNAGRKYYRMPYSAILSTFNKLPFVIKIFILSIFEWPLKTGFTVFV